MEGWDGGEDGHPDEEIFEELGQAGGSGLLGMGKEFIVDSSP